MPDDLPLDYFPSATEACPTFDGDTGWTPLVDGATYLPELAATLRRCGAGDSVIVVGLELDPDVDLDGRPPGNPDREPLGELLARLAADGVDVRIVLANRALPSSTPGSFFGGFRATAKDAERLRALRVGAVRPLAGRVLLDFSGAFLGSNHQKAVVCRVAGETIGFVGGIDLVANRFDRGPHALLRLNGERWGWHDMGRAGDRTRRRTGLAGVARALDGSIRPAAPLVPAHAGQRRAAQPRAVGR